ETHFRRPLFSVLFLRNLLQCLLRVGSLSRRHSILVVRRRWRRAEAPNRYPVAGVSDAVLCDGHAALFHSHCESGQPGICALARIAEMAFPAAWIRLLLSADSSAGDSFPNNRKTKRAASSRLFFLRSA